MRFGDQKYFFQTFKEEFSPASENIFQKRCLEIYKVVFEGLLTLKTNCKKSQFCRFSNEFLSKMRGKYNLTQDIGKPIDLLLVSIISNIDPFYLIGPIICQRDSTH